MPLWQNMALGTAPRRWGIRISLVELDGNEAVSYTTFIDGWLNDETQEQFGRPVDITVLGMMGPC